MDFDIKVVAGYFPALDTQPKRNDGNGLVYTIGLPVGLPADYGLHWAELRLPPGFPREGSAEIYVSPEAILRVPHVEGGGRICPPPDMGPMLAAPEDRIRMLLEDFDVFLEHILDESIFADFADEPINYWEIFVDQRKGNEYIFNVVTLGPPPNQPRMIEGELLTPRNIVIVPSGDSAFDERAVGALNGPEGQKRSKVLIAECPLESPLTPLNWPRSRGELEARLAERFEKTTAHHWMNRGAQKHRISTAHRIVLFRAAGYSYGYLLPSRSATTTIEYSCGPRRRGKKTLPPPRTPLPLIVTRMDPNWTVGRDVLTQVNTRQKCHVLVFGAGALGSSVIAQLAKAGIGRITLVDHDHMQSANIARHELGVSALYKTKVKALAKRLERDYPSCWFDPQPVKAQQWLKSNSLMGVDLVVDLTGEPSVRVLLEQQRAKHPCDLLIGWMEPYVAAAHACAIPAGTPWFRGSGDPLMALEAVHWPEDVIQSEPGCSARFQSYTAIEATHAVALVCEVAIEQIDSGVKRAFTRSWVRGQRFLDGCRPGLSLKRWAAQATQELGVLIERTF